LREEALEVVDAGLELRAAGATLLGGVQVGAVQWRVLVADAVAGRVLANPDDRGLVFGFDLDLGLLARQFLASKPVGDLLGGRPLFYLLLLDLLGEGRNGSAGDLNHLRRDLWHGFGFGYVHQPHTTTDEGGRGQQSDHADSTEDDEDDEKLLHGVLLIATFARRLGSDVGVLEF